MVSKTKVLYAAAKRVPLIQFRSKGGRTNLSAGHAAPAAAPTPPSPSPAAAVSASPPKPSPAPAPKPKIPIPPPASAAVHSLGIIEDWQLPARYHRKPIDAAEMDYINAGGPPV